VPGGRSAVFARAVGPHPPSPSARGRSSTELLCLNLLREFHTLLRTELLCSRFLAPLIGRAGRPRRFWILPSRLFQSTTNGHPDLLSKHK
jgi:hypothetical protein